jgi:hypothetical protein
MISWALSGRGALLRLCGPPYTLSDWRLAEQLCSDVILSFESIKTDSLSLFLRGRFRQLLWTQTLDSPQNSKSVRVGSVKSSRCQVASAVSQKIHHNQWYPLTTSLRRRTRRSPSSVCQTHSTRKKKTRTTQNGILPWNPKSTTRKGILWTQTSTQHMLAASLVVVPIQASHTRTKTDLYLVSNGSLLQQARMHLRRPLRLSIATLLRLLHILYRTDRVMITFRGRLIETLVRVTSSPPRPRYVMFAEDAYGVS